MDNLLDLCVTHEGPMECYDHYRNQQKKMFRVSPLCHNDKLTLIQLAYGMRKNQMSIAMDYLSPNQHVSKKNHQIIFLVRC